MRSQKSSAQISIWHVNHSRGLVIIVLLILLLLKQVLQRLTAFQFSFFCISVVAYYLTIMYLPTDIIDTFFILMCSIRLQASMGPILSLDGTLPVSAHIRHMFIYSLISYGIFISDFLEGIFCSSWLLLIPRRLSSECNVHVEAIS